MLATSSNICLIEKNQYCHRVMARLIGRPSNPPHKSVR